MHSFTATAPFSSIGLIAGNRSLPLLLAKQLNSVAAARQSADNSANSSRAARRLRIVAVAFHGETDPALAQFVDDIVWLKVGQLGKLIHAFTERGVHHCVMAGQIAPKNLFDLHPDWRALKLLWRLRNPVGRAVPCPPPAYSSEAATRLYPGEDGAHGVTRPTDSEDGGSRPTSTQEPRSTRRLGVNAHSLFSAIAEELHKEGIELIEATPWLKPFMPGPGFQLGPKLSPAQRQDVEFGFRIAKEISRLDIGQTVVVRQGTVLAVEGFEGTDACLARGGELAGKGRAEGGKLKAEILSRFNLQPSALPPVAVKVAKRDHDMRFDIPCLGPETLKVCAAAGIAVLAFEADRSLLLEQEACAALAKTHNISLVTVTEGGLRAET